MSNLGFASVDAARMSLRRLRLRDGLVRMERSVPALVDLLDQRLEADCREVLARAREAVDLASSDSSGRIDDRPIDAIEGNQVREEELLEGMNLCLQFLDVLASELGHGRFSFQSFDTLDATAAAGGAHRLCESRK